MSNRADAIKLFVYYFKLIALKSGVKWDSDNSAEITQAVESIFDDLDAHFNSQVHTHV